MQQRSNNNHNYQDEYQNYEQIPMDLRAEMIHLPTVTTETPALDPNHDTPSNNNHGTNNVDLQEAKNQREFIENVVSERLSFISEKEGRRNVKEDRTVTFYSHAKYFIPRWRKIPVKGDMVRDLQAIESTFLSWVRTGVALIALGVAVVRIVRSENATTNRTFAKAVGTAFIIGGLLIFFYSWIRHLNSMGRMVEGEGKYFVMDGVTPLLFVIFGIIVSVLSLLLIFL